MLLFDYCLLDNQTSSIVFWVPFFFEKQGFGFDATWMVFSYSIGTSIGALIINPLLKFFPEKASPATVFLLFIECCCLFSVFLIEKDKENLGAFITLFGFASILLISPASRSASTEVAERVENDRENYLVVNFMRVVRELISALSIILIGQMIEIEAMYFLYILVGNALISAILNLIRRVKQYYERKNEQRDEDIEITETKKKKTKKKRKKSTKK